MNIVRSKRAIAAAAAAAWCGVAGASNAAQAASQSFRFDSGTSGWNVYDIYYYGQPLSNPQSNMPVPFDAGFGLPPGSARISDLMAETWIGATSAVEGDKSSLYGSGSVSFDIFIRQSDELPYAAVALYGGGFTLYITNGSPPINQWAHRDFALVPGAWRIGSLSGPIASEAELLQVLADFKGLFLHTEWKTGTDDTNVDNIILGVCPPDDPACCQGDLDDDGSVGATDLAILLGSWSTIGPGDLDLSGGVDAQDLAILLGAWGDC